MKNKLFKAFIALMLAMVMLTAVFPLRHASAKVATEEKQPEAPNTVKLTPSYTPSSYYRNSSFYTQLCNVTLTGDQRTDIVNVALSQYGYYEGNCESDYDGGNSDHAHSFDNWTEYGYWYGMKHGGSDWFHGDNASWCAVFVDWCARQAGISEDIINDAVYAKINGSASDGDFVNMDFYDDGTYEPKPGDLVVYDWAGDSTHWDHIEIVYSVDKTNRTFCSIGGNSGRWYYPKSDIYISSVKVEKHEDWSWTDSEVHGFAVPHYDETPLPGKPVITDTIIENNGTTTIKWTAASNANYYNVRFYKGGECFHIVREITDTQVNCDLTNGECGVTVSAVNAAGATVSDGVTFYIPSKRTVTFKDWDGTVLKTEIVKNGGYATAPADPSRDGYVFIGWDNTFDKVWSDLVVTAQYGVVPGKPVITDTIIENNGTTTIKWTAASDAEKYTVRFYKGGECFHIVREITDTQVNCDLTNGECGVTVSAVNAAGATVSDGVTFYIPSKRTVTFKDWDGTILKTEIVKNGGYATAPADPSRDGYVFIGWDNTFDKVWHDLEVTAVYTLNTVTVTYTGAYNGTAEVPYGGSAALPVLDAVGVHYTFTVNGEPWDGMNITEDVTVEVGMDINVYTVQFVDPIDAAVLDTQQVTHGQNAAAPEAPEHYGYTFGGWDASFTNVQGDMTVTAIYTPISFTVIFMDGCDNVIETQSVPYHTAAAAPADPEREGWTFAGWDVDFSCIEHDTIINALWERNYYTVTFTGVYSATVTVEHGADCELPVYNSNSIHYTFTVDGEPWDGRNITADVTVTVGIAVNGTYTVTFVDWNGTVLSEQTVSYGNAAAAPSGPKREGYTFTGWDADFSNITADLTVTALYEQNSGTVTLPGDTNCDGVVDSIDALLAMRYSMNLVALSEQGRINGDVNGDGSVNATDAIMIIRSIL